ncbi:MAG: 2-deoxy-D-gluconate 3-dehydrogenase [Pelagibacterales bacterium]|nr:2-deoxy-D-gluconate 3-dehydrogenase [Pelagibacterales bacterium]OUU63463.1 MAG: hypothetical protein CBC22_01070 [Alphaproteobacteria bacterium TMED62]|tara:strand:+ start:7093 stop:7824 length:732 start_codon:yes stop_codon:yes gene_type:complete
MNKKQFKDKIILITGGVRGIGLKCAEKFSLLGSKVIVTCKSNTSYDHFKKSCSEKNIQLEKLDLTNELSINILHKKLDKLDILINNATLLKGGIEYRIENFSDVVNVNLMGLMRICHTFLPKLALSQGNIVNISSVSTKSPMSKAPSYSATKSAIESLTKSMASCWATHKVRVNCVAPGFIEGTTLNKILESYDNNDEIVKRIPLKRFGFPEEVAEAVMFLTSNGASYITGSTIFVDGGYSIS